jgi:hypothetical protein
MTKLAKRIGTALLVLGIVYFGLKGLVVTIWKPPSIPTTYSVEGNDGRMLMITFLPKSQVILVYTTEGGKNIEANLATMKGVYGTHYLWRLWHVDGPGRIGGWFGFRLYPPGFKPVLMESTVQKKFKHGTSEPVLAKQGVTTYPVLLFSENEMEFEGMRLRRTEADSSLLDALRERLQ